MTSLCSPGCPLEVLLRISSSWAMRTSSVCLVCCQRRNAQQNLLFTIVPFWMPASIHGAGGKKGCPQAEDTSPLATMRRASLIAAISDGHPYSSLIRAIASLSAGSNRTVVALIVCFPMRKGYHIDILLATCYNQDA